MKVAYKHLSKYFYKEYSINEVSEKLLQLGHEHEICNGIIDFDFTPNRGDCLSLNGILRELAVFFDINFDQEKYDNKINSFPIDFTNNAKEECTQISFLKIEIETEVDKYIGVLNDYFTDLNINKNNFFTDVSNYISYETGQPTHCYDAATIDDCLILDYINSEEDFETLLDNKIELKDKNLVFIKGNEIINLAGVIGGKSTACSTSTKSVIVECAYFEPKEIVGKSIKYDINSDAAHKFERGVDPKCHDDVLRRYIKIVQEHANIKNVELFSKNYKEQNKKPIPLRLDKINNILGTEVSETQFENYLTKLGFLIKDKIIYPPSYRNDIKNDNDIAEEIARVIGYDNIIRKGIVFHQSNIPSKKNINNILKELLIDNGFYEVINNPFIEFKTKKSIEIDNPLDSTKKYLRTSLKHSLINNLLYNERRQKDSVKIFEISDVYSSPGTNEKKNILGIIASGRLGNNYKEFSKKITNEYILSILMTYFSEEDIFIENISRDSLNSKLKTPIFYLEINIDDALDKIYEYKNLSGPPSNFIQYKPISDYPSSTRDLSFSLKEASKVRELEDILLSIKTEHLKSVFVFDYFKNEKTSVTKVGFRFVFQSEIETLTEEQINNNISDIIDASIKIKDVSIDGLN